MNAFDNIFDCQCNAISRPRNSLKNKKQKIVPIVIAAAPKQRKGKYGPTDIDFKRFNQDNKNNCQKLRYITFSPDKMLKFEEVDYKKI